MKQIVRNPTAKTISSTESFPTVISQKQFKKYLGYPAEKLIFYFLIDTVTCLVLPPFSFLAFQFISSDVIYISQKHETQEQTQKDVNMLIMSKIQLHCIYITSGIYA